MGRVDAAWAHAPVDVPTTHEDVYRGRGGVRGAPRRHAHGRRVRPGRRPLTLIEALLAHAGARDLTIISNNLGEPGRGLGRLLLEGRVRKAVGSYFTSNPDVVRAHHEGRLEVELVPQGTLAESIRAGGAGIGGFFTKTGLGTPLTGGCEERVMRGERYVLQEGRRADVALVRARAADELGNLVYSKTARNFNPDMATAADLVIAEVDEVLPAGALDPEAVVTPHLFVDALVVRA